MGYSIFWFCKIMPLKESQVWFRPEGFAESEHPLLVFLEPLNREIW